MVAKSQEATATSNRELTLTRMLDAPPHRVFDVWTQPEHLSRWLGPREFIATVCTMDVRVGGRYRICLRSPDGTHHWMQGVYREIIAPHRLVFTFAWEDETGQPKHETLITLMFTEHDGKTKLDFHQALFESVEGRDSHRQGWSESFDRLEAYLTGAIAPDTP